MTLSPLRLRFLVASLLAVSFLGALDHTIVSTSLATIAGELGALEHMSWIIVGYTLASTVLLPVLGKLGDAVGPRRVFIVALIGFIVASAACGFAPSMGWLIVARVVQGMCSAGLQLMSQTIVARVTTPRQRPQYMAIIGMAFPVAILLGPVLGGLITDYWAWPWVFWINIPLGLAALVLTLFAVPKLPAGTRARLDVAGSVVFTLALVALVLAVTWVGEPSLAGPSWAAFAVALIGLCAFFVIERRASEPVLPLSLFRNRTIWVCCVLAAIIGIGLFSVTAYLPTYFQMAYGTSATVSGLVPIATVFGMLVSNLASGWLVSRTGHYRAYPIAGTSLGAIGLLCMSLLPLTTPLWVCMVVMGVVGLGTGSFMSLLLAIAQSAAPSSQLGVVTAATNLVRQVGSTVATAVVGGVIGFGVAALLPAGMDAASLTPQLVHGSSPSVQAEIAVIYHDVFAPVFFALACVYAVGIVAAVLLPHNPLSDDTASIPVVERQNA